MSTIASKVPIGWCTCLFLFIVLAKGLRLPMEWPAHVMFLLPLTSPTQGSWTVQIHSVALEVGGMLPSFPVSLEGAGEEWRWVEVGVCGKREPSPTYGFLHGLPCPAVDELLCFSHPPLYSNVSFGKSVF